MASFTRFLYGVGLFGRGLLLYLRTPRLLLLGLTPTLLSAALFLAALVALFHFLPDLATQVTWFAEDWSPAARAAATVVAATGIVLVALLLSVVTFTAVTLAIGNPFYERISDWVERAHGGVDAEVEVGFWRGLWRGLGESARLFAVTAAIGVSLFLAGLVPVVGQTVVPVVGAAVGGWFLALELVGTPLGRRGLRLADRRRLLRTHRPEALGFGVTVFVCFLVPGAAVLLTPAAVVGGTLLARHVLRAT